MADETAGADEQSKDTAATESDTSTEDTKNDGASEGEGDEGEDSDADKKGADVSAGDDAEPPVRKSAKDYIIERKDKKIAKLENGNDSNQDGEGEDRGARPLTINDLNQALEPLKRSLVQSEDEKELQAAFTKYPEAKKLEKTVRKYMENDAYAKVPVEFIVKGILGARDTAKKKADEDAAATRQGGHTRRPKESKDKSAWDLSDAEFEKEIAKAMQGQR